MVESSRHEAQSPRGVEAEGFFLTVSCSGVRIDDVRSIRVCKAAAAEARQRSCDVRVHEVSSSAVSTFVTADARQRV